MHVEAALGRMPDDRMAAGGNACMLGTVFLLRCIALAQNVQFTGV